MFCQLCIDERGALLRRHGFPLTVAITRDCRHLARKSGLQPPQHELAAALAGVRTGRCLEDLRRSCGLPEESQFDSKTQ